MISTLPPPGYEFLIKNPSQVTAKCALSFTSSKEEAMQKALEYIGEFVTEDESDIDNLDSIYMEVEQLPNTELEEEE